MQCYPRNWRGRQRFEEPLLKDTGLLRQALGCSLGDVVGFLVHTPGHALQLQAQELFLHLAYVRQVCFHVFILRLVHFVGEVDEELGVALDGEALHTQSGCGLEAGDQASYSMMLLETFLPCWKQSCMA